MSEIFEETLLAGIRLRNRLVRSATWEGMAGPSGKVTPELVAFYQALAEGEVGLIISSYLYVELRGKQNFGQMGAHKSELLPGLRLLAEGVHESGGRLVGQIVHCGGQADRRANGGTQPVAPSALPSPGYREVPGELSLAEIDELIERFAAAATMLKSAGFDGVQLHGAHGYLLSQFLSPLRNQRQDRYGGDLENRCRFTLDVYRAIRKTVGDAFPIMIKLNGNDFMEGSTTEKDSVFLAARLAEEGIDAIEVSGGTPGSGKKLSAARPEIRMPEDEAYFLPQARAIRAAVPDVPLMLVGGLRSLEVMETILERGEADYFSMARPFIREPDLALRWRRGNRRRAACISCLGCFGPARRGDGLYCVNA